MLPTTTFVFQQIWSNSAKGQRSHFDDVQSGDNIRPMTASPRLPKNISASNIPVSQMDATDSYGEQQQIERRFSRNTYIFIAAASVTGLSWSGWKMCLGILLGGSLSLINKRWLQGSLQAMLDHTVARESGRVPPFTASRFILRYFLIALAIGLAVWTGWAHPLGIGVGFAAFVGGIMMEAAYQLYLGFKSPAENENSSQE